MTTHIEVTDVCLAAIALDDAWHREDNGEKEAIREKNNAEMRAQCHRERKTEISNALQALVKGGAIYTISRMGARA